MKNVRLFIVSMLLPLTAFAQQSINSHTFSFSDTLETVQVEDALGPNSELAKHRYLIRGSYDFVNDALIAIDPTRTIDRFSVVRRLHSVGLGGGWMVTKRFLIGIEVPLHYVRLGGDFITNYSLTRDTSKWVLGDINLRAKIRLTSDDSSVNAAIMPYAIFPTGNANYFISDDSYGFGGKLIVDAEVLPILHLYGNAGYTYVPHAEFLNIDRTRRVELAAGAYVKVLGDKLGLNGEVINAITLPGYDKDQNPIAIRVGFRARTGIVRWYFGGALEGVQNARSNDVSLYAGVKMPFGTWEEKPEPAAPLPDPEPITVEKKIEILKENLSIRREINFETAKDVILPESFGELDSAADIINQYGQYISTITIEGHTDSRGSDPYNLDLSQRRANSVKKYLVEKGVPSDKLQAIGYGERQPKVKEIDAATLRINRRVEFKVSESIEIKKEIRETSGEPKKK